MDDTKKIEAEDMPETGGDVRAVNSDIQSEDIGQKGGEAVQRKQEEESFKEFKDKGNEPKSEDSQNQHQDLWGEE